MVVEVRRVDLERPGDLEAALALADRVFDLFEAPEYPLEGVREFHSFTEPELVRPKIEADEMQMWVALDGEAIVGMIALRSVNHICLFFVDDAHHRQGIGHLLYQAVQNHLRRLKREFVSVYSSPYAVLVYERLGFVRVAKEQLVNDMRCNPLCAYIG